MPRLLHKDSRLCSSVSTVVLTRCVALATSGIYLYKLLSFSDPAPTSVDQLAYRNYPLKNCSVAYVGVMNHEISVTVKCFLLFINHWQAFVTCNTSIDQYMYFKVPRETVNPLNSRLRGEAVRTHLDAILQSDALIPIDLAYILWMQSLSRLLDLVIPSEGQSLVYQPPIASNVSFFSMRFDGAILPKFVETDVRLFSRTRIQYSGPRSLDTPRRVSAPERDNAPKDRYNLRTRWNH